MTFFFVILSILSMMAGYVWWRIVIPTGIGGYLFAASIMFAVLAVVLPFISIFLRFAGIYNRFVFALTWTTFIILGFVTMLFLFIAVRDVLLVFTLAALKLADMAGLLSELSPLSDFLINSVSRTAFINHCNAGLSLFTVALMIWGVFSALAGPVVESVDIALPGLPDAFDGFRIIQISDLHAGSTVTKKQFRKIIEQTQALGGDLIALTGDIADGRPSALADMTAPLDILDAPYGKFFVTGNHEYYSGVHAWVETMKEFGFDVLINEHRIIERASEKLIIAGVTDFEGGRFAPDHVSSPVKAMDGADTAIPSILLAHQPLSIVEAAKAGIDLVLAGHTHGGQYFPWNFFVGVQQPYVRGLHRYENTAIYINRGSAFWGPPLRAGVPAEITVITLRTE